MQVERHVLFAPPVGVVLHSPQRRSQSSATSRPASPRSSRATGLDGHLATGNGLLTFESVEEAAAALDAVEERYLEHSHAARRMAETDLDAAASSARFSNAPAHEARARGPDSRLLSTAARRSDQFDVSWRRVEPEG